MYIATPLFTEFVNAKEILWLGIDFTLAKFTRKGFEVSQEQLRTYFNEWNQLIISDQKKYDIRILPEHDAKVRSLYPHHRP